MEREYELLQGTVQAVTFQNPQNGYTVLRLHEDCGELITVVGTIPMAVPGERLVITGTWGSHPTYGRQFVAEFLERLLPQSAGEILSYLSSRAVKGIGPVTAQKMVSQFGARTLDVLENDPESLTQVEGISRKKAYQMSQEFRRLTSVRRLIEFLAAHSIPAELAVRLYSAFGESAMDEIRRDPYLMTEPAFGADFARVDAFAMAMGVSNEDEQRVEAGVLFELSHNLTNGHVFIPWDKLSSASASLLDLPLELVEEGMERLKTQGRMDTDTLIGLTLCYLPELYEAETYVASRLAEMAKITDCAPKNLEKYLISINEKRGGYARNQLEAICSAATFRLLVVTGGPGTGKTTTMAGILELCDLLGYKTQLAAPTGRAAKRLTECTGREAATIHRLLESQYDPESGLMLFTRDEAEPLKADLLIVDEASMVDLSLMSALLHALPSDCRLVLVGDPDQLPSVGAGNVFSDIIRSGVCKTVRLTEIFRQAQESLIVLNAHAINHGELPELSQKDKDFFFLRRKDGESLVQTVMDLCSQRLPKNMGIAPQDIQVLSPTRKGMVGTANLNKCLQSVLNPPAPNKRERPYGDFIFREGDRVMQIRNNYDIVWNYVNQAGSGTGIFNGDIGVIKTIDPATETMTVLYDDRLASYPFDALMELEPAYAMTVHKSQGSEYKAVILTALGGSPYLMSRSILYTAVTRARELLIIVGNEETVAAMVQNDKQQKRYSGLKLRLEAEMD